MKTFCAILTLAVFSAPGALACVGCRTMGPDVEQQTIQAGIGFSWSVVIMLGFIMSLLSGLVWYIIHSCRRLEQRHSQHPRA